jgi:peptidoglycan/xylan/chitin deacetylase (PgdA/CDA1 family)
MPRLTRSPLVALLLVLVAVACTGTPPASPSPTPSGVAGSPSASPIGTPAPSAPPATSAPQPTFAIHVVASGDTLSSIARANGTSWQSLVYWNRDRYPVLDPDDAAYDPDAIQAGWTLALLRGVVLDYTPQPAPRTPPPSQAPATPTPAPGEASRLVTNGSRARNQIALTLDMGGRLEPAVAIMQWLVDNDIKATIFPTGKSVADQPVARQVIAILDAHPELFALGSHSYTHPDFRELSPAQMRRELTDTEAALRARTARDPRPLFRPPFGGYDDETLRTLGEAGYGYTVMWDVDTIDWRPTSDGGPTADAIVAKVAANAKGGSIVLMHLGGYHTLEALPGIVRELSRRGYTFVTVPEMLGL